MCKSTLYFPHWQVVSKVSVKPLLQCVLLSHIEETLGTLRYSGGNKNVKKAIGLVSKTTTLHMHQTLLYISLPSLQECEVKMPNFTFYGGCKQATVNVSFSS